MDDPKLTDESARLSALHSYRVLDTPPDVPFDKITNIVKTMFVVPMVAVSLIDEKRLWFKSRQGINVCGTPRDISFCTHAIMSHKPTLILDTLLDQRFKDNPLVTGMPHIRSYAGVPLKTPDGYNIGSLCVMDTVPRTYEPSQIEVLKSFASLVMDEFELRRAAYSDYLTGAMSRRAFVSEMDRFIARYGRDGNSGSLILFDIDRFKSINDTWGHPAGDSVLKRVAATVMDTMRDGDVFGRIGGEEFGILQHSSETTGAMLAAERFRSAIERMTVDHSLSPTVTASFGISTLSESISTSDAWLAEADRGLYAAKAGGRNRCCAAS